MAKRLSFIVIFAAAFAFSGIGVLHAADLDAKKKDANAPAPERADAPAPFFDYVAGGKVMSDYRSRGISQSARSPGATVYGELRLNPTDWVQPYVGTQIWRTELPTKPLGEFDLYAGLRPTFGKFSGDFGYVYYLYPDNTRRYWMNTQTGVTTGSAGAGGVCPTGVYCPITAKDPSYFELYAKPGYNVTDALNITANFFWSPNSGNTGPRDLYSSLIATYTITDAWSVSGEIGHQSFTHSNASYGYAPLFSYQTWNVGVTYKYAVASLDLRYVGSSQSKSQCYANASDPKGNPAGLVANGLSNWCGNAVVATLSMDLTAKDINVFLGK